MKICWDNLENIKLSKEGNFRSASGSSFDYVDECEYCGNPFLAYSFPIRNHKFCDRECYFSHKKLNSNKDSWHVRNKDYTKQYAKTYRKKNRDVLLRNKREYYRAFSTFSTFAKQIDYIEEVRRDYNDDELLQVRCTYCGKWFNPTRMQVSNRIGAIHNRKDSGDGRFYCSDGCKQACSIYRQKKYPKGFKPSTSREVQPELRQLVFERDAWTCQKCSNIKSLHCHHITGIGQNPIESADIDNCITLCKRCHKWVHSQEGCRYLDLRRCA
jgi:hypothetical protein